MGGGRLSMRGGWGERERDTADEVPWVGGSFSNEHRGSRNWRADPTGGNQDGDTKDSKSQLSTLAHARPTTKTQYLLNYLVIYVYVYL